MNLGRNLVVTQFTSSATNVVDSVNRTRLFAVGLFADGIQHAAAKLPLIREDDIERTRAGIHTLEQGLPALLQTGLGKPRPSAPGPPAPPPEPEPPLPARASVRDRGMRPPRQSFARATVAGTQAADRAVSASHGRSTSFPEGERATAAAMQAADRAVSASHGRSTSFPEGERGGADGADSPGPRPDIASDPSSTLREAIVPIARRHDDGDSATSGLVPQRTAGAGADTKSPPAKKSTVKKAAARKAATKKTTDKKATVKTTAAKTATKKTAQEASAAPQAAQRGADREMTQGLSRPGTGDDSTGVSPGVPETTRAPEVDGAQEFPATAAGSLDREGPSDD